MDNDQLRAVLADGRVHTNAELAPQFGVTFREVRRRVGELRAAPTGRPVDDVWTGDGDGYQARERRQRPRNPA